LKKGPYGFYVQVGEDKKKPKPKRASVPRNVNHVDVTLEKALSLLSLPRLVGKHPEDGKDVLASIGPFGPYLKWNGKFYSVKNDDILTIGLNRSVIVIMEVAEAKRLRAEAKAKKGGKVTVKKKKATAKKKTTTKKKATVKKKAVTKKKVTVKKKKVVKKK